MRNIFSKKIKTPEDTQTLRLYETKRETLLEEKQKVSEVRYRRLFESAKDGILILDFDSGEIIDANPFIIEIIDYPLHEIKGKKLWEIGLFSNKEESESAFIELKTKGYIRFEDMPIQSRNGKIREVEFISNVYLESNKLVIQCNIREITERKHSERKQQLAAKIVSILNNEVNWKLSVNQIMTEIKNFTGIEAIGIRLKKNGDFPYFATIGFSERFILEENYPCSLNEKGEFTGDANGDPNQKILSDDIISAQSVSDLKDLTVGGSYYCNAISQLIAEGSQKEIQYSTLHRCKAEGYESIALIPLHSGNQIIGLLHLNDKSPDKISLDMIHFFEEIGNSIGITFNRIQNENKIKESEQRLKKQNAEFLTLNLEYSALNESLTESLDRIQNINEELIQSKIKAEESDKLKTAFLANMSHEIRTPMNAILGFSDFLLTPGLSSEKLADYVQIINISGRQLMSVISDIIDISKIESGQISIDMELVNINTLMSELFEIYKNLAEIKKLSLNSICEHPTNLIQINTDGNRIKQVFCNLLNNSLKFTKEGKIEYGYTIRGNYIEFFVRDTGMGIAPENHALIFQRFRQVEATNNQIYSGNGLGLSISKALIEKLGGSISVFSELNTGSLFVFTIPYKTETENNVVPLIAENSAQPVNWNDRTILIVEDEKNNHAYIEELLKTTSVNLLHAWDGKEAVEQVKAHPDISLVLMDVKIPILNGYEATQIVKQIRPNLPVIALTAYALSHDKSQALEAGCNDYLSKPIDRVQFIKVLSRYLSYSEITAGQ